MSPTKKEVPTKKKSPTAKQLAAMVAEIQARLAEHGDPAIVKKYAYYFKEGYDAFGLPTGVFEKIREELFEKYSQQLDFAGFLDLADILIRHPKYEEGSLAITWLMKFRNEFTAETFERVGKWFDDGVRNWAHSDYLCGDTMSYFLLDGVIDYRAFKEWRTMESKWRRRAVPVSLLIYLRDNAETRKKADVLKVGTLTKLLAFVEPLMKDQERVVHQGLGWFLREAWKRDPEPVEAFLLKYKDTAARLIFQYATEKMSKEQKERFRKAK